MAAGARSTGAPGDAPGGASQHASRHVPRHASRHIYLGAFGQPGHAFPMLALGRALVARGHRVTFETWERWREPVQALGIEFVAAPEFPVFPTMERPLKPYEAVVRATVPARAEVAARRPDLVVHDILTLAPAMAAELEGIPRATLVPHLYPVMEAGFPPYSVGARLPRTRLGRELWGLFDQRLEQGLRLGRDELNETRRRLGLPAQERLHGGLSEDLCLVASFPQLEYPRQWPAHVHVVGPMLWEPPAPAITPPAGEAPLVVIAPSTSHDPQQRLIRACLEGLRDLPVRVLASLDRRPLAAGVSADTGRLRLVNWMSYSAAMREASLVVCHGGWGTTAQALVSGVPVLVVPHSGDMAETAARLDWAGVGVRLPWRLLSACTLRLAAGRALAEHERLSTRALELAAWAGVHDGPIRAAALIEEFLGR